MFSPKKALWFVAGILLLSTIISVVVFVRSTQGARYVTASLAELQQKAPQMTLEQCADETMTWFQHCDVMSQLCIDNVPRMMKVCLMHGDKANQCHTYADKIDHFNFGYEQCTPYLSDRPAKRACSDVWRIVSDYCKAVRATTPVNTPAPTQTSGKTSS
jgi:hypothetical protein